MAVHTAYISVGSNVGNKVDNCLTGIRMLIDGPGIEAAGRAPLYITEPVGFPDQDWFINTLAVVRTDLGPESLLAAVFDVQDTMGRRKGGIRFGPRVIDLDILFFDDTVMHTDRLEIPHPRLHQRRFVLKPLCDVAPDLVHPLLGRTVSDMLDNLPAGQERIFSYPCDC